MSSFIVFILSLPFIVAGIAWDLITSGFAVGIEFSRRFIRS